MTITEVAYFLMPTDLELQFAAMAIVQNYVNGYAGRARDPAYNPGQANYILQWRTSPNTNWDLFTKAGLVLCIPRSEEEVVSIPDLVVDLREEKLDPALWPGKHACQAAGVLAGVAPPPLPVVRRVKPCYNADQWVVVAKDASEILAMFNLPCAISIDIDGIVAAKDGAISGVIGVAGAETYLAAAMGLPVIEIQPEGRPRNWLSKFTAPHYRMVAHSGIVPVPVQVHRAFTSINGEMQYLSQKG
jgi:hypothetical protein